jgi:membrane fusion protein (multidrug efflux system)
MHFFVLKYRSCFRISLHVLFVLAIGTSLFVSGCKKTVAQNGTMPPLEVAVATVAQRDVPIYGEWVGNLDGFVNAQIQPQVSGYLVRQNYHEGQQVHKGDVLFEIDPRSFQAALDQAQGQLAQAKAQLELSRINMKRDEPLVAAHALAQSQLDTDRQQEAQNEGIVKTDEAIVRMAQLNLGWTQVHSLIDGIAGKANVQVGNLVNTSTALTTVSQVDPIKAFFSISEQEYLDLSEATKRQGASNLLSGKSAIPLELLLSNGQAYPFKGTIVFVDRGVDTNTGTITIAGSFPNGAHLLRPGQFARVRALASVQKSAILVPQRAVIDQQGKHLVAVVDKHDIAQMRLVTVGKQVGGDWIITSGLNPGESVVTEGNGKIQGTVPVRPVTESASVAGGQ